MSVLNNYIEIFTDLNFVEKKSFTSIPKWWIESDE